MNGLPYYKRYPRDFVEGTIGMPFEVKATYSIILDLIYMQGGGLPDDARYISGLLGVSVRKWNSLRQKLIDFGKIQVTGELLTNYRAVSELESLSKFQDKQAENRSRPNKNNDLQSPKQSPKQHHTEPEPEPYNILTSKRDFDGGLGDTGSDGDFDKFWQSVPRKVGKGQARKAYRAALKKTDAETIQIGIEKFAASVIGKDPTYIAHPSSWLNGERWDDEGVSDTRSFREKPKAEWTAKDREAAAMQWL